MNRKIVGLFSLCAMSLVSCGTIRSSSTTSVESSVSTSSQESLSSSSVSSTMPSTIARFLNQLQAPELIYTGHLNQHVAFADGEEDYPTEITGLISEDRFYNEDSSYGITDYYRGKDGNVEFRSLNPLDNTIESIPAKDADGKSVSFAENYFNPFMELTEDDLSRTGEEVTVNLDSETMAMTAGMLTMYADLGFDSLVFQIDDEGNILEGTFTGPQQTLTDETSGSYTMETEFTFSLTTKEESGIYDIPRDPEKDAIPELDSLFTKLAEGNYTVDYFSQYCYKAIR